MPVDDAVNEELTIESMFQIYDKDSGEVIDLRDIIDLDQTDCQNNEELQKALEHMNKIKPIS